MVAPGETLVLHSYAHPEVYFGIEGEGEVIIDGQHHRLAPGIAILIPGGAVHGIPLATSPLKWFYTFAADSFAAALERQYPRVECDLDSQREAHLSRLHEDHPATRALPPQTAGQDARQSAGRSLRCCS